MMRHVPLAARLFTLSRFFDLLVMQAFYLHISNYIQKNLVGHRWMRRMVRNWAPKRWYLLMQRAQLAAKS